MSTTRFCGHKERHVPVHACPTFKWIREAAPAANTHFLEGGSANSKYQCLHKRYYDAICKLNTYGLGRRGSRKNHRLEHLLVTNMMNV